MHFKYMISHSCGVQWFLWEMCWWPYEGSLVCYKSPLCYCVKIFLFNLRVYLQCVSWVSLDIFYLEFVQLLVFIYLCLSSNIGRFQLLFLQVVFLALSISHFPFKLSIVCKLVFLMIFHLSDRICSVFTFYTFCCEDLISLLLHFQNCVFFLLSIKSGLLYMHDCF
jgi:hypothetical protein